MIVSDRKRKRADLAYFKIEPKKGLAEEENVAFAVIATDETPSYRLLEVLFVGEDGKEQVFISLFRTSSAHIFHPGRHDC